MPTMDMTGDGGSSGRGSGGFDWTFGIGDIISGIGTAVGGIAQANAIEEANANNIASAREQMNFQNNMSSTAYQRAVLDMKAAGLNPALAYSQGGASSPSGAMATSQPVNKLSGLAPAISSALDARQTMAATEKIKSDTSLNPGIKDINKAQARKITEDANISSAEAEMAKQRSDFYKKYPQLIPIKEVLGTTSSAVSQLGTGALMYKALKPSEAGKGSTLSKDEKSILKSYNKGKGYLRRLD